jgi:hypothetical protein
MIYFDVLRADAGYSDMCDIDKAQSIPDLERFKPMTYFIVSSP